jgi:hypothetical protein
MPFTVTWFAEPNYIKRPFVILMMPMNTFIVAASFAWFRNKRALSYGIPDQNVSGPL